MHTMQSSVAAAQWLTHVNGVQPTRQMAGWLTDRMSLTVKLIAHSDRFKVRRLAQGRALCLEDETAAVGLPHRTCVREREVLLCCDERPVVFAHTIVPLLASASDWPFFSSLGERSLGTTLFNDPLVRRGALEYARLPARHPLALRARHAVGDTVGIGDVLFARRCLFRRKNGVLLVTEVFLPTISGLVLQKAMPLRTVRSDQRVYK
jgi:chorismate--pyruvate lyase